MRLYLLLLLFIITFSTSVRGQFFLKSEYITSSPFRDVDNNKIGESKGAAAISQIGLSLPVSFKVNENNRPTAWIISMMGTHTNFNNKHLPRSYSPDEVLNLDLGVMYIRPLKEKLSIMGIFGAGVYTPHANFSKIQMRHVLANGGAVVIFHLRNNLDLGAGLVVNNSFGYPMVFPGMVLQWRLEGKYEVNVQMMNAIELSAGVQLTNYLKLYLTANMDASMALEKINGKNMIFTHQYVNVGLQPTFLLGKGFSIPLIVGITPYRAAFYQERSLKTFFRSEGDFDPHFSLAAYGSIGLRYGF